MKYDDLIGKSFYYPKNDHIYTFRGVVRSKDRTTGKWYDAVLYTRNGEKFIRELGDFMSKFVKLKDEA